MTLLFLTPWGCINHAIILGAQPGLSVVLHPKHLGLCTNGCCLFWVDFDLMEQFMVIGCGELFCASMLSSTCMPLGLLGSFPC